MNWPEDQCLTKEEIKKAHTWHQKGTELLTKKVWYLTCILAMASEPVKMSKLMNAVYDP